MLTGIDITNYRGFKHYRMKGLARVNLLVGKNNCGKTALLEGLDLLTSNGEPTILSDIARRRGEVTRSYIDVSQLFHGRIVQPGSTVQFRGEDGDSAAPMVSLSIGEIQRDQPSLFEEKSVRLTLRIESSEPLPQERRTFWISAEGGILSSQLRRASSVEGSSSASPVFIASDLLVPDLLSRMWDGVIIGKRETEVLRAMQILEPKLEDIIFQPGEPSYRHMTGRASVLVGFRGERRRVPLGSLGDGMRHLLDLSISLVHTGNGALFVDEIDTGLHFSVLPEMWKLVVETAVRNEAQFFSTTHSWDCVSGLAQLCRQEPQLMPQVAVHKIDAALEESVSFSGEKLVQAVEGGIELR